MMFICYFILEKENISVMKKWKFTLNENWREKVKENIFNRKSFFEKKLGNKFMLAIHRERTSWNKCVYAEKKREIFVWCFCG